MGSCRPPYYSPAKHFHTQSIFAANEASSQSPPRDYWLYRHRRIIEACNTKKQLQRFASKQLPFAAAIIALRLPRLPSDLFARVLSSTHIHSCPQ